MPALSVVISVDRESLDFKSALSRVMQAVAPLNGSEIIVVDGSGGTQVAKICRAYGVCVYPSVADSATHRNIGAAQAHGDYLLFMEADMTLPENFSDVWRMVRRRGYVWGFFSFSVAPARFPLRCIARLISLRSRLSGCAITDQGLFVQRNAWRLVQDGTGGLPLSQLVTCKRLGVIVRPLVLRQTMESGSQRWQRIGFFALVRAGLSAHLDPRARHRGVDAKTSASEQSSSKRKRTPELP